MPYMDAFIITQSVNSNDEQNIDKYKYKNVIIDVNKIRLLHDIAIYLIVDVHILIKK